MQLYRIKSPYYCAGIILNKQLQCVKAAPILYWMIGKTYDTIKKYCLYKGIEMLLVDLWLEKGD